MAITSNDTLLINSSQIADLANNPAVNDLTVGYIATAVSGFIDVDVTGKQGILVYCDKIASTSIDGGTTDVPLELDAGLRGYINIPNEVTSVRLKTTVDAGSFAYLVG